MAINVGEVMVETTRDAAPAAPATSTAAAARPDPNEIRLILRREDDRRERLWAD